MPRSTIPPPTRPPSGGLPASFDKDVARVVLQLRAALAGVFSALGKPIRGGTDLQRELGLPSTLSWQIHGFINSPDPITAAGQIPGRQASKRALAAAAARGVPRDVLDRAARAFDEFEACVERHTGSRAAFASMVSALSPAETAGADLKARREAYRANGHVFGVQLATLFNCFILHPGDTPGCYDYVFINGSVGLRVMRSFEKLFVGRHSSEPDKPGGPRVKAQPIFDALEDPGGAGPIPVLTEFSSSPLPHFSSEAGTTSHRELYISGPPVGRTGELTFFLAEHFPGAVPIDEELRFDGTVPHPTELMHHDVLLPASIAERYEPPTTGVFGGALHELRRKYRDVDRINVHSESSFAGEGVDALQTPVSACYADLLRRVCERLGWDPESFLTYRCRVEYPVLHSLVNVTFRLRGLRT